MVQLKNLMVLKAPSSFCPYSRHLTLINRMDKIIGTWKAMRVFHKEGKADEE